MQKSKAGSPRRKGTWLGKTGEQHPAHGLKRSDATKAKMSASNAKFTWEIISPAGEVLVIRSLTQFCKENGLYPGTMVQVAAGFKKSYRGFVCRKIS